MYAIIFLILLVLSIVSTSNPSFMDLSSMLYGALMIAVVFPYIRLIYKSGKAGKMGRLIMGILLPVINFTLVVCAMLFANGTLYKVYFPWYKNTPEIEQLRVQLEPLLSNLEYRQAVNAITLVCIVVTILFYFVAIALTPRVSQKKGSDLNATAITPGTLLMTMYPNVGDRYKFKELKVYRRADGRTYYTEDDRYKHEGTPSVFCKDVKHFTSIGAELNTGLGRIEVNGVRLEKVKLSEATDKIHGEDPLYKKYVNNRHIACEKNVNFSDGVLSAYSKMNHTQRTQLAGLYSYSYQLDYKDCEKITTLLRRIMEGITPEQAAKAEAKAKGIAIGFCTVVGVLVAAYMIWYNFF